MTPALFRFATAPDDAGRNKLSKKEGNDIIEESRALHCLVITKNTIGGSLSTLSRLLRIINGDLHPSCLKRGGGRTWERVCQAYSNGIRTGYAFCMFPKNTWE